MKKLNINIKYHLRDNTVSNQQVTQNYILGAANSKYENGMDNLSRRIFARIVGKLDSAIEKNIDEIELEATELDFLKTILKDSKLVAAMALNSILLEDQIDLLLK